MTEEKIKALLEAGSITQEEADAMLQMLTPADPEPNTDPVDPEPKNEPIDYDKLDKIIQSRVDKQMAAERKKNAELEKKYKSLQQAKLTDEEYKKAEMEEKEKLIEEREKALAEKENRLYAVKAIKEAGLDDGSDVALSLVDFVMGGDETETDEKVKSFKALFDKAVNAAVDAEVKKRFKDSAYTPKKGENLNGGKNPYDKSQWNFTEQMKLEVQNPELAAQLKAAAGVK